MRFLFLAFLSLAVSAFAVPPDQEPMSGKSVLQYWADNDIKAGWNLGNTMEAVKNGVGTEGEWDWAGGPGRATQALFNGVKESGFDIVRIPVTWIGHIGSSPNYEVSKARLQRVDSIIGYAKTAGIKSMIINIHHDGNPDHPGFLHLNDAVNNPSKKSEIENELKVVWTQIAEYFKNYGDYLIFETMNEVHDGQGNWGYGSVSDDNYKKQQDILFDWNQAALSAIRATGGNNATRFVAIPGLGSTEPEIVISAYERGKLLPENGTDKLIVAVHYYYPSEYTVEDPVVDTWNNSKRGRPASDMKSLKDKFIDKGIAVYLGEWGAPTDLRKNKSEEIKATHREYLRTVASSAAANGVLPISWDDGGYFKILERSNGKPASGLASDVLSDIMGALKSSSSTAGSSSSSSGTTPITPNTQLTAAPTPTYYSLKGEPLGNTKPQKAGIYIIKQGHSIKKIAVR